MGLGGRPRGVEWGEEVWREGRDEPLVVACDGAGCLRGARGAGLRRGVFGGDGGGWAGGERGLRGCGVVEVFFGVHFWVGLVAEGGFAFVGFGGGGFEVLRGVRG